MREIAERMERMIENEIMKSMAVTTNVVPIDPDNTLTAGKMRAMLQTIEMEMQRRPPPVRLQMVRSHVWRTYGMWSLGVTSADRWRMWCRKEATEDRLERNPVHDAMPSDYLKMPEFDFLGRVRGEVIYCKGERAYYAALNAAKI